MTDDPAANAALFDDIYRRYVHMVLYARAGAGTWGDDRELTHFTVVLSEPVTICINDEPHGWTPARSVRSLEPGERLELTDVTTEQVPRPDPQGHPHVSAEKTQAGWRVSYDFRHTHPRTLDLLATGEEFLAAAQLAFDGGSLRVFVENAFHATESFAKAELLSSPIAADEVESTRKHAHLQSAYDLWAMLGNTDTRFPALLRELSGLRRAATYADGRLDLSRETAAHQLATLQELREHAAGIGSSTKGRVINVIATRDINAGSLVSSSDATIRPPKPDPPTKRKPRGR